ncbi:DNA polymerase I [Fructilactobacillus fructivorans]|uniref:DNA polymerase I n=1 Tax=Fructilactobacillus fructivorans TaxID=1614 RepID=A0A0C1M6Z5_9LACO|nr:DNA polymerase I [Fructilactobacillus fructivorans]KID42099.1 DNA polymerase I [Fructilactobacillus fructivorans]MCT0151991.1 DNA polymerase I [Fructilactobacillus fructivorans]MCT2867883.1 DNA polymerase I [Fructilactobacillus fructivorans]MCT2868535.1 DNA polymerase I [Fructilactobacillus fructivorans]MCT2873535.1 DNA polymerase I [Fructilactobacillus fructivorans]
MADKKLLLIDGNSLTYKAFFALFTSLERFTNEDGLHTSAIYGFNRMLDDILKDVQPTSALAAFDAGKTTFRTKMYEDYKAGRAKMPDELREQFPFVMDLLHDRGIKTYELKNYEADDIIGTLAKEASKKGYHVTIITGDRDLTQLCSDKVTVAISKKGVSEIEKYTPSFVKETMGITPEQIIDVKGLQGDNSDNYPGVEKVGPKTAVKLIQQFGSIENLYEHIDEVSGKKLKEHLIRDKDQALLSKKLATIDRDAPLTISLSDLKYDGADNDKLVDFYKKMNMKSFLREMEGASNQDAEKLPDVKYTVLTKDNLDELDQLSGEIVFNIEMLEENYHVAPFAGFVIGNQNHWYVSRDIDLLDDPKIKNILENKNIKKNVFDAKAQIVAANRENIKLNSVDFDMLLASYLLNTLDNSNDLAKVANRHNYYGVKPDSEVYGTGKKKEIPADDHVFFTHIVRKALAIDELKDKMIDDLKKHNQLDLYRNMEVPLSYVLSEMEIEGITVDVDTLEALKSKFTEHLSEIEQAIYQEAGEEFNIGSPKQLGEILFDKLKLPVVKKTKTGYSTSVDVLEKLAGLNPIIDNVLAYRQLSKLISTYIDGIKKDIYSRDHKVHTRYLQTLTQTGRLSSVDPNLQNIPVRTEEGRKIREAFVPRHKDWELFSSDYSQVELRVLAAISGDKNMQEAFKNGEDIHAATARRIFELPSNEDVTSELRRQAKAVNFGIVYGISAYGLAKNTGISRKRAQEFIDKYFREYPGVKKYTEDSVKFAEDHGYAETIMKRRRYLPDINSKQFQKRSFAERTAMNSPIQGSAADIVKVAMIRMQRELKKRGLKATMLLQIHDELIFEAPKDEIPVLEKLVPSIMDSAVDLDVPLKVESHYGPNWYDIKK